MLKVTKFGGTSMASADTITKIKEIVFSDPSRRYVVVSAPGKRYSKDEKVTDLLYQSYDLCKSGKSAEFEETLNRIKGRYLDIARGLKLEVNFDPLFAQIRDGIIASNEPDFAASRGEYLGAILVGIALGFPVVDAAEIVKFNDDGSFNEDVTNMLCSQRLSQVEKAVIAGFYGATKSGRIKTFSRGGSDISGAIVARAVQADVYENWTDISGFKVADPRIVDNPKTIRYLSYKELRELSYMGAGVLHSESIFPVKYGKIPINIRNTFAPEEEGTFIVSDVVKEDAPIITGIAGKKGYMSINIEKSMMNNEIGFGRRILSILEHYRVSFEHIPSGIDTFSIVIEESELTGKLDSILKEINTIIKPDHMDTGSGIAIIATVGHGMTNSIGTAARLFKALSEQKINIKMIDQGSSELNIIVGVDEKDYEKAIKAIYNEFLD